MNLTGAEGVETVLFVSENLFVVDNSRTPVYIRIRPMVVFSSRRSRLNKVCGFMYAECIRCIRIVPAHSQASQVQKFGCEVSHDACLLSKAFDDGSYIHFGAGRRT